MPKSNFIISFVLSRINQLRGPSQEVPLAVSIDVCEELVASIESISDVYVVTQVKHGIQELYFPYRCS